MKLTTIQVKSTTLILLKKAKITDRESYDAIINRLLKWEFEVNPITESQETRDLEKAKIRILNNLKIKELESEIKNQK